MTKSTEHTGKFFPLLHRAHFAVLAAFPLLCPIASFADAPAKKAEKLTRIMHPFLWTIERDDKPSYLFGTIHIPREEVTNLPAAVKAAFDSADVVQVEIPLDAATQMRVQGEMFRSDGKSLEESVGKDLYRRADKIMQKRGLSIEAFNGFKTSGAAAMLGMIDFMKDMTTSPPLDMKLFQDAIAADKEVGGIETAEEQIEILFNMEERKAVHLFKGSVEDIEKADAEGTPQGEKMLQYYLAGDLDDLMDMMFETYDQNDPIEKEFIDKMLNKRNHVMAKRIDQRLRNNNDKTFFFAIGAAHMPGDDGVIKLLQDRGWKITRVERDAATPAAKK